jgi:hypothetical protein
MTRAFATLRLVPVLALACGAGCKARTDEFYAKVYACSGKGAAECGTTRSGKPMTCVSAVTLGGTEFCAESCDPLHPEQAPEGTICMATGALLQKCTPAGDDGGASSCPPSLSCYRTSLTQNAGVCLAMPVCSSDDDPCGGGTNVCATKVIKAVVSPAVAPSLAIDHLHCVTTGCTSVGMACPLRQSCIGSQLGFGAPIDDLCVPACDSNQDCPPNFTCLHDAVSAPDGPRLCFPGMVGARCSVQQNCLVGSCVDVGVEFNVCSVPCRSDDDCKPLNMASDVYVCAGNHCLTPRPFQGANCTVQSDAGVTCPLGEQCFDESPYGAPHHGECRVPCDARGLCPARGGLPHVCLGKDHDGGCYPSSFGLPCQTKADCIADFDCLPAVDDAPRSTTGYSAKICTLPCTADADCDADTWTKRRGYCSSEGICRLSGGLGTTCDRNAQCESRRCSQSTCQPPI